MWIRDSMHVKKYLFYICIETLNDLFYSARRDWVNPAAHGLVVISSSDGRQLPYGKLENILSRDTSPLNCHSNDSK